MPLWKISKITAFANEAQKWISLNENVHYQEKRLFSESCQSFAFALDWRKVLCSLLPSHMPYNTANIFLVI